MSVLCLRPHSDTPSVGQSRYVTVKISEFRLGKRDTSVTNKRFFILLHNVFFVKKS